MLGTSYFGAWNFAPGSLIHTTGFSRVVLNFDLAEFGGRYQVEATGFSRVEIHFLPDSKAKLEGPRD